MAYAAPLPVVRRYHDAWTAGRFAEAQGCLTPDLETDVPINTYANAGEWMIAVARTRELARDVDMLGEYCSEDGALLLYDMVIDPPIGTLRIAEQFMVKDGCIVKIRHVHDTHALRTAQEGGGTDGVASEGTARAVADLSNGLVLASVEVTAAPDRVFTALASDEIVEWWLRVGVFDTRTWAGDVRVGGHWESSGLVMGRPYSLHGEYLTIERPDRLVHTYQRGDVPHDAASTVSYVLEPIARGTRITLRHSGFSSREVCTSNCLGWETSLARLAALLGAEAGDAG